jgi:hypothetical protein
MDIQPSGQRPQVVSLRTPDELFARLDCTHIDSLNNPGQNLHLERMPEGFQYTAGSAGAQQHYSRAFPSLDAVYEDWDRVYVRVEDWDGASVRRAVRRFSLREAIWQDVSASPHSPVACIVCFGAPSRARLNSVSTWTTSKELLTART